MDAAAGAFVVGLIFWVVIATLVGGLVGSRKGRGGLGALLGFLLGWIGVLIIAIMKPSQQFEQQKTIAQAKVLREALGGGLVTATPPPSTGVMITPEVRQELMLEAIRRDPTLAASSDPETLKRLGETMDALEKEYVLTAELDQLKATQESQAYRAEEALRVEELRVERMAAEAAAAEAARIIAQQKAETRAAEIAAMKPLRRFIATKPALAVAVLAVALAVVATAIYIPLSISAKNATEEAAVERAAAEELAIARSTDCEKDIDPEDSLIGTQWASENGKSGIYFADSCLTFSPKGSAPDRLSLKEWAREGDVVTVSTDGLRWAMRISGDTMKVDSVQIVGSGILEPSDKTLSYTRTN